MKSILDVLQPELESASISPPTSPTLIPIGSSRTPRPNTAQTTTTVTFAKKNELSTPPRLTDTHRRLCKRLSPLLAIEATLTRKLLAIPEFAPVLPSPSSAKAGATLGDPPTITNTNTTTTQPALTVRAGSGWKRLLQLAIRAPVEAEGGPRRSAMADRNRDDPTSVLAACKQDIISLWTDPVLKEILKERGVRPENASGFFLDDVDRIAVHTYEPTPSKSLIYFHFWWIK
jgi:guanine nucleotide-binding protein alpha-1 subunit